MSILSFSANKCPNAYQNDAEKITVLYARGGLRTHYPNLSNRAEFQHLRTLRLYNVDFKAEFTRGGISKSFEDSLNLIRTIEKYPSLNEAREYVDGTVSRFQLDKSESPWQIQRHIINHIKPSTICHYTSKTEGH